MTNQLSQINKLKFSVNYHLGKGFVNWDNEIFSDACNLWLLHKTNRHHLTPIQLHFVSGLILGK